MPSRELAAYVEALPAIAAERSLSAVSETAAATGSMKKGARDDLLSGWRQALRSRIRPSRPRSAAELQLYAAASGFSVKPLKRKAMPDA